MRVITASVVVTPSGPVRPGRVTVDGTQVVAVEAGLPEADGPRYPVLVPGFVDLQVNGVGEVDVADAQGPDWERLDRLLVDQGVTTWCPTITTLPLDAYAQPLDRIARAAAERDGIHERRPHIAGAHLEGPFLAVPGAHPAELLLPVDLDWLAQLPAVVKVVTLAPESDGGIAAVTALADRGVLVALGHSAATFDEAVAAIDAGARLVTHLFNGMAPMHHRAPGLVGAALADDRVACSVIADGIHVHPALVKAAARAKGPGRTALITDAISVGGLSSASLNLRRGAPTLPDGTLAGTVLTMDAAVRNAVAWGMDLADAVAAASTTPAALLGDPGRGRIAPGARADLVALSELPDLQVIQVWIGGHPIRAEPMPQ